MQQYRIVKYGHLHYISKTGWKETSQFYAKLGHEMEHMLMWGTKPSEEELSKIEGSDLPANIISENETIWVYDLHPELVGKEATIVGSYATLYGGNKSELTEKDYRSYSIEGAAGKSSWYDEEQLELVISKTFDESILTQIVMLLDKEGVVVSNIVHIGDNVFEMDFADNVVFLAGTFGKLQATIKEGKVKVLKKKITGMA